MVVYRFAIVVLASATAASAERSKLRPSADIVGTSIDVDTSDRVYGYEDRSAIGVPLPRWDVGGGALTFGRVGTNIFEHEGDEFHLLSYATGLVGGKALGHGLVLGGGATVTYASALDEYSGDAWQLMVNGSVSWTRGDSDGFIVGAVYTSTSTLRIPIVPILGWVHQAPDSPWHFDILLPRGIRIDRAQVRGTLAARYQHHLFVPLRIDVRAGVMIEELEMPTEMSSTSTLPIRPAAYGQFGITAGP